MAGPLLTSQHAHSGCASQRSGPLHPKDYRVSSSRRHAQHKDGAVGEPGRAQLGQRARQSAGRSRHLPHHEARHQRFRLGSSESRGYRHPVCFQPRSLNEQPFPDCRSRAGACRGICRSRCSRLCRYRRSDRRQRHRGVQPTMSNGGAPPKRPAPVRSAVTNRAHLDSSGPPTQLHPDERSDPWRPVSAEAARVDRFHDADRGGSEDYDE